MKYFPLREKDFDIFIDYLPKVPECKSLTIDIEDDEI